MYSMVVKLAIRAGQKLKNDSCVVRERDYFTCVQTMKNAYEEVMGTSINCRLETK
jgi:hypothetical protein